MTTAIDAYSSIPYEKGANFLLYLGEPETYLVLDNPPKFWRRLERQLGGLDVFLAYAKDYVKTFVGQSIGTEEWKAHLYSYFKANGGDEKVTILDSVNWDVSGAYLSEILWNYC